MDNMFYGKCRGGMSSSKSSVIFDPNGGLFNMLELPELKVVDFGKVAGVVEPITYSGCAIILM